jgi:exodeoxyribonuclease VII large subunit
VLWEEDPIEPVDPTYSVSELAEVLGNVVHRAFPEEIWVRGEIHDISRPPSGHVYFQLVEGRGTATAASLPVILSARSKGRINESLKRAGGGVRMVDGTEVRIRGRMDWFAPRGQLQLRMTVIDPAYTLGQMAAARDELLARLKEEGLLDRNSTLVVPLVPLRIGLITSEGSAAAADFVHELRASGFAFQITVADVRVQGLEAATSVVAALAAFAEDPPDVVAIVRGGGARTDLAAFDGELIARAIAQMPVPVFTGIGHEVDRSIADEVAHTSLKTPTACAQALVLAVRSTTDRFDQIWQRIASVADRVVAAHDDHLRHNARHAGRSVDHALRASAAQLERAGQRVHRSSGAVLEASVARVERGAGRATGAARHHLVSADAAASAAGYRLAARAPRGAAVATRRLDALEAQLRAHDPARTLARGWSITRGPGGAVVRDPAAVSPGEQLITTVAGGEVRSTVVDDG